MSPVRTPRPRAAARGTRSLEEMSGDRLTIRVVAVVEPGDAETVAHAFHHGAVAAVEWQADTGRILEVAVAAARGDALLPSGTARGLPGHGGDPHAERPRVGEEETQGLRAGAAGAEGGGR